MAKRQEHDDSKKLAEMFANAYAGKLPDIDAAIHAAGYTKGPGWVVGSVGEVADFLGISWRRVNVFIKDGMPRESLPGNRKYQYDLRQIVQWRLERQKEKEVNEDDPLMSGPKSPALEKYREERWRTARIERMKLEGEVISVAELREGLDMLGATLKAAAKVLRSQVGNKAHEILSDAITQYEREVDERFPDDPEVSEE